MAAIPPDRTVGIVGAGAMGTGIAQIAASAGHRVRLYDMREGAVDAAITNLSKTLDTLVSKGRLAADKADLVRGRLEPAESLADFDVAALVVEAIAEDVEAKRRLFAELEGIVGDDCILASNTSSLSISALARGLARPERVAGFHFFNPAPVMALVEIVSGLSTSHDVAAALFDTAAAWGKSPVHAASTPGFVVNRCARPFYAEALRLLTERAADAATIDAVMRDAGGFRMGPCELIDLIGHDTNYAVTQSVYEANFFDKRFIPSLVQREMVDGGLFGRKSGRGFYRYPEGAPALPVAVHEAPATARVVTVHGDDAIADALEAAVTQALAAQGWGPAREKGSGWTGVEIDGARLALTDGRTAAQVAADSGCADVAVFDRLVQLPAAPGTALAYALAPQASAAWCVQAPAWLAALGLSPLPVADTPGLVVARTVAMLINEAADAVLQGVCTPEGADAAMKLGVNYPAGPFEWLQGWSRTGVITVLEALDAQYRGERFRVSTWLRREA